MICDRSSTVTPSNGRGRDMWSYGTAIDATLLADLADEYGALDAPLARLDAAGWERPTPAPGWAVADQVRHLVASERAAAVALAGRGGELFDGTLTAEPVRATADADLLDEWREARAITLASFAALDDRAKVVWGAGPMSVRSFAESRLMETWAHALDCFAAAGEEPVDTARLRHVAGLGLRALPYAFAVAGTEPPGDVRRLALELTGPTGECWWFGPQTADARITGLAGEWCRVAVRRLPPTAATSLVATDPLARAALLVARAYLAD